jgi:hypothetical protein
MNPMKTGMGVGESEYRNPKAAKRPAVCCTCEKVRNRQKV